MTKLIRSLKLQKRQHGRVLLELLISTALGIILTLSITGYLSHAIQLLINIRRHSQTIYTKELSLALLEQGLKEFDYHALDTLAPQIHTNYINFLSDNFTIELEQKDPKSGAITFIELSPDSIIQVKSMGAATAFGCGTFSESPSDIRSVLAIGSEAVSEYFLHSKISSKDCHTLRLTKARHSMIATQLAQDIRFLIPIRRIYTLYRSQSGTLRYLGHAGEHIIENQPISNHLPVWSFALTRDKIGRHALKVDFKHPSKTIEETVTLWNAIEHLPLAFTALNPPMALPK